MAVGRMDLEFGKVNERNPLRFDVPKDNPAAWSTVKGALGEINRRMGAV